MNNLAERARAARLGMTKDIDKLLLEMADKIERLSHQLYHYDEMSKAFHNCNKLIEEQDEEIERLTAALREIADKDSGVAGGIAWAALEGK